MTTIAGIPIPSDSPYFIGVIGIHVAAALVCVVSGLIAMLSKKMPGRHPNAGRIYYWGLMIVFITATIISFIRWKEDHLLFVLGFAAFASATIGRMAKRSVWRHWPRIHIPAMGMSYIIMLTAFYVDNGKNLPVWKELPPIVYWTLPAIIGIPIIIYALRKHPLAKI